MYLSLTAHVRGHLGFTVVLTVGANSLTVLLARAIICIKS